MKITIPKFSSSIFKQHFWLVVIDKIRWLKKVLLELKKKIEIYELPIDAIREAVINAVVHRDYFLSGSHTVIEFFDDRLEISNPGGLPKGLSEKEFGKKAVRRNQIIASLLHRVNLVENMGTGINKIKKLLKEANAEVPEFKFGDFYTMIFPFAKKEMSEKMSEKMSEEMTIKILEILKKNSKISAKNIANILGKSSRTVEREIQNLKENGKLKRIGADKGGY